MKSSEVLSKLEEKRQREGLTQAEIAEEIGYSREIYNKWQNGKEKPSEETLLDLFEFLQGDKSRGATIIVKDPEGGKKIFLNSHSDLAGTVDTLNRVLKVPENKNGEENRK